MKSSIFPIILVLLFGACGSPRGSTSGDTGNGDARNNGDNGTDDAANGGEDDGPRVADMFRDAGDFEDASEDGGEGVDVNDGPEPVILRSAGDYVILAKSGVSTTGATAVVGDIGLSPADGTYITGFAQNAPPTTFTTSALVTGQIFAANYDEPTPTNLTAAVSAMETAYTDAAGRTLPDFTELGAGNIDGLTLVPGLYKWGTGVSIPIGVTLEGGSNDVWIFQVAEDLVVGNGAIVTLAGGAQAQNVFWQVAGQVTLGTTADFKGIILSQTLIEMKTGAALLGRALAQTAVTLDATAITQP